MIVATEPLSAGGVRRVVVPTMGALHEGHRALIREAREFAGSSGDVVVTIFVNPTQFIAGEDFERYPRTLDADLEACRDEGADVVYTPDVTTVYGSRDPAERITISPGPLGEILEGEHRPGHFAGVLTVVSILLRQVRATAAVFGEKDYQQLQLIRRMSEDLSLGLEILGVPTVREDDGLAMSSRNAYLSVDDRARAAAIWRALEAGAGHAAAGPDAVVRAARDELARAELSADYLDVRADDLGPAPSQGLARLLTAVRVGETRLIDNCEIFLGVR